MVQLFVEDEHSKDVCLSKEDGALTNPYEEGIRSFEERTRNLQAGRE